MKENDKPKLKKHDKVVMHSCVEAINYHGCIWKCEEDSFYNKEGVEVVYLIGYVGYFSVKYLNKINVR